MVVCKFYLQGTCKFGEYCKFEHQIPNGYTSFTDNSGSSTSILRQSNFGAPQTPAPKQTNVDTTALVNAVVNDMTQAEKGGQWLFSSYAPFKEKPAFPGFSDQSFEEIRLGFYDAQKNGSVDQYKQQLQVMLQELMTKVKALQNPSPDIINVLKMIYNTPPSSCSGVFGSTNTSTNVFANSTNTSSNFGQQSSIFGQQTNSSSIFSNKNTTGQPQNSIFGNNNATNPPAQTSNSIFGGGTTNNSNIFGGNTQTTQQPNVQNSVFGGQNTNNTNSVFQSGNSIFAQANKSIFGGGNQENQSIFSQNQQQSAGSPFNQQQTASSPFNQQQTASSPFNQQQNVGSPFNQQQSANNSPFNQHIFAQQQQNSNSPFAQQQISNSSPFNQQQTQSNIFANNSNTVDNTNSVNIQQQATSNIFAKPIENNQQSIFAQTIESNQQNPVSPISPPVQANVFGTNNSIFGQNNTQNVPKSEVVSAQSHSASIFGTNVPQNPTIGQSQSILSLKREENAVDMAVYSKMEELSEEDIKWFQSDDLDIENIPENAPAYELVF